MSPNVNEIIATLPSRWREAVRHFWGTRDSQKTEQKIRGISDAGARGAVTGGKQMNGFLDVIAGLLRSAGVPENCLMIRSRLELPGFYRPTKRWDILVVGNSQLIAVIEAKSLVGSIGNNLNNRIEEAIGSATDLWVAFREGAFNSSVKPWLGYLFVLEDAPKSREPKTVREPHFHVFSEYKDASYAKRCELFCSKLFRERLYDSTALLLTSKTDGESGEYFEPARDLTLEKFSRSLVAHVTAHQEWL